MTLETRMVSHPKDPIEGRIYTVYASEEIKVNKTLSREISEKIFYNLPQPRIHEILD